MPFSPLSRLLALATALVALTGCGGDPAPAYAQAFGFQCSQAAGGFTRAMCGKSDTPKAAEVSRYCYETLADANCFDQPDPQSKNQALGSSGY